MLNSQDMPLASNPVDRAAHHRTDEGWLANARRDEAVLVFLMRAGELLIEGGKGDQQPLVWLGSNAFSLGAGHELFLGKDKNGSPIFALEMAADWSANGTPLEGLGEFVDMRAAASLLSPLEANLASTARSLLEWHRKHGYCSNCGAASDVREAGWKRQCPKCETEHWPRTDPVAIMLATRGDKCLMARQAGWPAGFISALAGFVEPGETVEQAAARELFEEAGIHADPANAEYLFCQPWPFPSSLMVGIIIPADSEEISVEQDELEEAFWITRAEARQMLAGSHPRFFCPPPMAVAHHILKTWAEREA